MALTIRDSANAANEMSLQGTSGAAHVRHIPKAHSAAFANPAALGAASVVPAQGAGVKIRVLGFVVVTTAAQTVKFQSGATDISAGFPLAANGSVSSGHYPGGMFETNANEALNINLGAATATGVQVIWEAVTA